MRIFFSQAFIIAEFHKVTNFIAQSVPVVDGCGYKRLVSHLRSPQRGFAIVVLLVHF